MKPARRTVSSLLLLMLLAGCGQGGDKPAAGGPGRGGGMPPPEVDVITVGRGSVTLTLDLPGRLVAWRTAEVRARVEGIVEKRLFREGSDVAAGTTLFLIDPRTYQAARDAAAADVEAAGLLVKRYKKLLKIKALSPQDLDAARARLKQSRAALARAELDLENTRVPAPIAGRIGRTFVTEGALVGRGEATHLATIEQIDPIYVDFTQPNADRLRLSEALKSGKLNPNESAKVELVLEDGSVYPYPGRILFSELAVEPSTGAVSSRAKFPNPEQELLPGMFVRIRVPQAQMTDVIRVPQRTVQAGPEGQFVMIVTPDGKAALQPVRTGGMVDTDFIVVEGLKGGETIIVNGLQKARPGMPVVAKPLAALQPRLSPNPVPAAGEGSGGKQGA